MKKKTCICGRTFTPKDEKQKYHSIKCEEAFENDLFCRNCGRLIEDDQDLLFCSERCRIEHTENPSRELRSARGTIECDCPKCGVKHQRRMNWTGRGTPKMFCDICRHVAEGVEGGAETECQISTEVQSP